MEKRISNEIEYTVDENGIIQDPGNFQGQPIYVPYCHQVYIDCFATEDDGNHMIFEVTDEDRAIFPELVGIAEVFISVNADGSVNSSIREREA